VGNLGIDINNLTSALDITGKAGQYAAQFADPLKSLLNLGNFDVTSLIDTGDIGNLARSLGGDAVGAVTDLLGGDVVGAVTDFIEGLGPLTDITSSLSSLTSLTGPLSSLANFSGLANFGGLGALGAIGGLFGGGGDGLVSSTQVAAGYSNTVNRGTLDVATQKIIGSAKVPLPIFEYPSPGSISLNASKDILAASNILQGLKGLGGTLLSQATGQITNSVNGVAGRAGGVISDALNRFV
jgi:hypothetical protein